MGVLYQHIITSDKRAASAAIDHLAQPMGKRVIWNLCQSAPPHSQNLPVGPHCGLQDDARTEGNRDPFRIISPPCHPLC